MFAPPTSRLLLSPLFLLLVGNIMFHALLSPLLYAMLAASASPVSHDHSMPPIDMGVLYSILPRYPPAYFLTHHAHPLTSPGSRGDWRSGVAHNRHRDHNLIMGLVVVQHRARARASTPQAVVWSVLQACARCASHHPDHVSRRRVRFQRRLGPGRAPGRAPAAPAAFSRLRGTAFSYATLSACIAW